MVCFEINNSRILFMSENVRNEIDCNSKLKCYVVLCMQICALSEGKLNNVQNN